MKEVARSVTRFTVDSSFIDNLMDHALEGGVNQWVEMVTLADGSELEKGQLYSRLLSQGIPILLHSAYLDTPTLLTVEDVTRGLGLYLTEAFKPDTLVVFCNDSVDEAMANAVIQYAIFEDVHFD